VEKFWGKKNVYPDEPESWGEKGTIVKGGEVKQGKVRCETPCSRIHETGKKIIGRGGQE